MYSCFAEHSASIQSLSSSNQDPPPNLGLIATITLDETRNRIRRRSIQNNENIIFYCKMRSFKVTERKHLYMLFRRHTCYLELEILNDYTQVLSALLVSIVSTTLLYIL